MTSFSPDDHDGFIEGPGLLVMGRQWIGYAATAGVNIARGLISQEPSYAGGPHNAIEDRHIDTPPAMPGMEESLDTGGSTRRSTAAFASRKTNMSPRDLEAAHAAGSMQFKREEVVESPTRYAAEKNQQPSLLGSVLRDGRGDKEVTTETRSDDEKTRTAFTKPG